MKKNNIILAIDYDGTVTEHSYPEVGAPLPGAFETLKDLKEAGYTLILWTCREGQTLEEAVSFCRENGVEFDSINENNIEDDFRPEDGLRRKIFAHYYIDDRAFGGFSGWDAVREKFL